MDQPRDHGTEPIERVDSDEQRRVDALHDLAVLDTLPEPVFDAITRAAADACGVPIALVSLVDAQRQWFKSNIGLPGVSQTPRDVAFCHHAIAENALFEVPDALADARFAVNPLVTGDPRIRFYAGAPIALPGGERIGTVCVIDREPHQLTDAQRAMLNGLAKVASVALLDRRRQVAMHRQLALSEARYRAIVEDQTELISLARPDGTLTFVNEAFARHFGVDVGALIGSNLLDLVVDADRDTVVSYLRQVAAEKSVHTQVNRSRAKAGTRWISWTNRPIDLPGGGVIIHSVGRDVTHEHLADAQLRQALGEKETLLKEVYHRVKNNLQLVQSLLSLQQRTTPDAAARSALSESARRVRAMALVHEKLYQAGNLAAVSLADYTQDLLRQIDEAAGASARGIRLLTAITERSTGLDSAIPFSLLVTELVFNALEHAFGDNRGGRVEVALTVREGVPWLTVSDDGTGPPPGFSLPSTGSMGLQLAASLAQQLGGALQFEARDGAAFTTALPRL